MGISRINWVGFLLSLVLTKDSAVLDLLLGLPPPATVQVPTTGHCLCFLGGHQSLRGYSLDQVMEARRRKDRSTICA